MIIGATSGDVMPQDWHHPEPAVALSTNHMYLTGIMPRVA